MARQVFLWAFIGHTGVGKTSTAVETAKIWKHANPNGKVIGFDPHDILKKEKLLDYYINANDENWAEWLMQKICSSCGSKNNYQNNECTKCKKNKLYYKFANSLLILDDYRSLLTRNDCPPDVLDLLQLRRRIGIDWIYIAHNPKLIIPRFVFYQTTMSIFFTESHASDWSDRIPNYASCQKASNLINTYVLSRIEDMRRVNPNAGKDDFMRICYPNFPHIIVNMDSDQLEAVNVDPKKINELELS